MRDGIISIRAPYNLFITATLLLKWMHQAIEVGGHMCDRGIYFSIFPRFFDCIFELIRQYGIFILQVIDVKYKEDAFLI